MASEDVAISAKTLRDGVDTIEVLVNRLVFVHS
jgi:hypothetical protein